MTREEALKKFAQYGAAWFGNSKQHFAFSAYCRLQGWNKLADKWKEEAEEEWEEAEEVLQRLVELGCKPADLQEAMKTMEFPFYDMFQGDVTYTDAALKANKFSIVFEDIKAARETLDRVRTFVRKNPTVYLSTHCPEDYENLELKRVMRI